MSLINNSVHLNAHILSKGLILVDLPGLRDLNSARRNITERYIFEVDEIFAVCLIGRATTDAGVAAVIELAKKARLSNVGIICTKSDVGLLEYPIIGTFLLMTLSRIYKQRKQREIGRAQDS